MNADEMKKRTRAFALRVIRLVEALPKVKTTDVIGKQLLRCGTSVGANYRASCRAKLQADFIAKMGIVEEEWDGSLFGMELLIASGRVKAERLTNLMREGGEILAITVASIKTARRATSRP